MPLRDQHRSRWDPRLIAEGFAHSEASASGCTVTSYHAEADIAAIPCLRAIVWRDRLAGGSPR